MVPKSALESSAPFLKFEVWGLDGVLKADAPEDLNLLGDAKVDCSNPLVLLNIDLL